MTPEDIPLYGYRQTEHREVPQVTFSIMKRGARNSTGPISDAAKNALRNFGENVYGFMVTRYQIGTRVHTKVGRLIVIRKKGDQLKALSEDASCGVSTIQKWIQDVDRSRIRRPTRKKSSPTKSDAPQFPTLGNLADMATAMQRTIGDVVSPGTFQVPAVIKPNEISDTIEDDSGGAKEHLQRG